MTGLDALAFYVGEAETVASEPPDAFTGARELLAYVGRLREAVRGVVTAYDAATDVGDSDLVEPLAVHVEAGPTEYRGGSFVVTCACGREFTGLDPDDAAAAFVAHIG